jgi:hypothetical protein
MPGIANLKKGLIFNLNKLFPATSGCGEEFDISQEFICSNYFISNSISFIQYDLSPAHARTCFKP